MMLGLGGDGGPLLIMQQIHKDCNYKPKRFESDFEIIRLSDVRYEEITVCPY